MNDLDAILIRLAGTPVPAALAGIDQHVFQGAASRRERRVRRKIGAVSISAALMIGVISTAVPLRDAATSSSLAPLGAISPLSPASLLGSL